MLAVVQPVNFVDAIRVEHGFVLSQRGQEHQTDVLFKMPPWLLRQRELLEESGLGKEPSCSLQDAACLAPAAKPRPRNALGPKPSCSLQDSAGGAAGLAGAELAGCAPPTQGGSAGTAGDNPDGGRAISAGCPGRPGGTRDRFQSCDDDNPAVAADDSRGVHKRSGEGGTGKAGTVVGSNGSGGRSSVGSGSGCEPLILSASQPIATFHVNQVEIRPGYTIGVKD